MRQSSSRSALTVVVVLALLVTMAGVPVASASANAPDAPLGLTVEDRERHMNVDGIPRFGWLPQDPDGNEVQTAYQIQVLDEHAENVVWDSGKVVSDQQSYVAYGGPALDPGTTYTWTVRTWDKTDQVSPWAEPGVFDSGLGNADWEGAQWIRRSTTEADDYTIARTEVEVHDSPVVRARLYVAVNHTAETFLNGVKVDRGSSFGYQGEQYYQATDVTGAIEAGEPLAIGVLYHWYGNGQGRPGHQRGLLVKLVIEHEDGTRDVVVTDNTWRVRRATWHISGSGTRNGEGDRIDRQDARAEIPDWNLPGANPSGWLTPQVVGTHPTATFPNLMGKAGRIQETIVHPVEILTANDGTLVADFGKVIPARPRVTFHEGVSGRNLTLRAGFNLQANGRVATSTLLTQGTNMSFTYIQKGGYQEYEAFTHLGWRYFELPGANEDLTVDDISAVLYHVETPAGRQATFASSDGTLDAVWDLVTRSALYSVQESFVDTPTREKGQFLGDTATTALTLMATTGERNQTRQAMREFLRSADRYWTSGNDIGRYNAVYPNGDGKRDIPDYSQTLPLWVWGYYQQTGDVALLEEAYPYIQNTADYVLRHIPAGGVHAGLVTRLTGGSGQYQFGIIDWPVHNRFGHDMSAWARTKINAMSVGILQVAADTAEILGRPASEVESYRDLHDALVDEMNARLRNDDGYYVDGLLQSGAQSGNASQLSNAYAVSFGIAPDEDVADLADYLASFGLQQGPMTVHWLLQALQRADRADVLLSLLTNPDDVGWANILSQGATFTWESWTLASGTNYSQSHGWGSVAAMDILETLLGVRTTSPGAATIDVVVPDGVLEHVSGSLPTQRGQVQVEWQRQLAVGGVRLEVDVPVNVRARVALPEVPGMRYHAAGAGEAVYVGTEGGRDIYEIGSGTSVFVVDVTADMREAVNGMGLHIGLWNPLNNMLDDVLEQLVLGDAEAACSVVDHLVTHVNDRQGKPTGPTAAQADELRAYADGIRAAIGC